MNSNHIYDAIVIGAGAAGLSAAIYLSRSKADFLVLEKGAPGGKLLNIPEIENYPGVKRIPGMKLAYDFYQEAQELGAKIEYGNVKDVRKNDGVFEVILEEESLFARFLVVATGLSAAQAPLKNQAKFLGKGVSTCATCDGNFYRNKDIVVYGRGEEANQEAIYLAGLVKHIDFLYVSSVLEGRGKSIEKLQGLGNIDIHFNCRALGFEGEQRAETLVYFQNKEKMQISASGFFVVLEEAGATAFLDGLSVEKKGNLLVIDPLSQETSVAGLYAAGDLSYGTMKQVVTASYQGALAASSIIKKL